MFYNLLGGVMYYKLRIKEYRELKNITQKALCEKVGISQSYLSELENNKYDIKLFLLCKIAKELDVLPEDLFYICEE